MLHLLLLNVTHKMLPLLTFSTLMPSPFKAPRRLEEDEGLMKHNSLGCLKIDLSVCHTQRSVLKY